MQQVFLVGNLGGDVVLAGEGTGQRATFRVAVSYREKRNGQWEKLSQWYSVVVFGARASFLASNLKKGDKVAVSGELTMVEKDGRSFLNVKASDAEPIWTGRNVGGEGQSPGSSSPDDLPF